MAAVTTDPNLISTDAKVLINDWQALHETIEKNTTLVKGNPLHETTQPNTGLLSERQLSDALQGPLQNFFKLKMTAYATIAKIRLMLIVTQDETFKNSRNTYPKDALQKISTADLDKMQKTLDDQTQLHYQQWQEQIQQWQQQLITNLTAHDTQLSDIEIKEFQDQEPLSELLARFIDLHIDISKPEVMNFEEYFHLKTHLTIHSSLSRRHQTHENHEIHKILKKLKKDFSAINKDEKELLTQQQLETDSVIEPITKIAQAQ